MNKFDRWQKLFNKAKIQTKNTASNACSTVKNLPKSGANYAVNTLEFYREDPTQAIIEILCGLSIAIMQVPESIAFSFVANISPTRGMFSTFFIGLWGGLITSLPGLVSGIAGAMVAIISEITSDEGPLKDYCMHDRVEVAMTTMFVCSLIQLIIGCLNLTKLIQLVSHSVMIGFMNGLAIIVFMAQLSAFKVNDGSSKSSVHDSCPITDYTPPPLQRWLKFNELELWLVLIVVALSMLIMVLQPKIPGSVKFGKLVINSSTFPPTLTAMILTTILGNIVYKAVGHPIKLIGDIAHFPGNLPQPHIPKWNRLDIVFQYSFMLALVGLMESVMTWQMMQNILKKNLSPDDGKWEAISQGVGNLWATMFNSVGGCVMVGQSYINLMSGAKGRLSTIVASFGILLIVSVAGPAIEMIPVATLTGIMFIVVIRSFQWKTFSYIAKLSIPKSDIVCIILVTALAVATNLAIAVIAGIAWNSIFYAWKSTHHIKIEHVQINESAVKFIIHGYIFFGSSNKLTQYFGNKETSDIIASNNTIVIDFDNSRIYDSSAIEFLKSIVHMGKELILINFDEFSLSTIEMSYKLRKCADQYSVEESNEVLK
jgi:SulP family sulfate permease